MKALVCGATGFVGRNLANALVLAGHQVVAASRRNCVDYGRMLHPNDWRPHLAGIDTVFNCVGIISETRGRSFQSLHAAAPMALFRACSEVGVRRVVQISALGADAAACSAYHLSKRAADEFLRGLDIEWFVLRPSLIYGRSGTSARLFMRLAGLPLIPVVGDGQQMVQPIHISDVVATAVRCMTSLASRLTLDLVGDHAITFAEWLRRMRDARGLRPAVMLRLPFPAAMAIAGVGRHFSSLLQPDNLRMLQAGSTADVRALAEFLGRRPLPFETHLFFCDAVPAGEAS